MSWPAAVAVILIMTIMALVITPPEHPPGMSTQPSDTVGCKQFRDVEIHACVLRDKRI